MNASLVGLRRMRKGKHGTEWKPVFLTILSEGFSVSSAARACGRSRREVYDEAEKDPLFKQGWEDAWQDGADVFEDILRLRALGDTAAATTQLRIRRPELFVERHELGGEIKGILWNMPITPEQLEADRLASSHSPRPAP